MLEPVYPVAFEDIVSLYRAVDRHKLQAHRSEIISLFRQNKALVERATRYITAAGSLLQDSMRVALSCTDTAKARAFAGTLSRRYISSSGEAPHEEIRLLSALTLQGIIFYSNTIAKLADTTVVPVSYTHLDVYKRQKQNSRVQFKLHPGCSIALMS